MPQAKHHASHAARQAAYRQRQEQARTAQRLQAGLPALPAISSIAGQARWTALLNQAHWSLETTQAEMQAYFESRTENWQESDKGERFQERLEALDELKESLELLCAD